MTFFSLNCIDKAYIVFFFSQGVGKSVIIEEIYQRLLIKVSHLDPSPLTVTVHQIVSQSHWISKVFTNEIVDLI